MEIDGIKIPDRCAHQPNLRRVCMELRKFRDPVQAAHMLTAVLSSGALKIMMEEEGVQK